MLLNNKVNHIDAYGLILLCFTGLIYFFGYLKYYILLRSIGIVAAVSDVFTTNTIFISGITLLISILFLPTISFLIGYIAERFISYVKKFTSFKTNGYYRFLRYATLYMALYALLLFPLSMLSHFLRGYIIKPYMHIRLIFNYIFSFDILIIGLMMASMLFKNKKVKIFRIAIVLIWGIFIIVSYSKKINDGILNDRSVSLYNQDNIRHGILFTIYPVSTQDKNDSITVKTYATSAILLSKKDTFLNFYIIQDNTLVMIPENAVILFKSY